MWTPSECVRIRWWDLAATESDSGSETAGVRMARHRRGVRAIEDCVSFRMTPGARDGRIVQVAQLDGRHVVQGLEVEPGSGGIAQVLTLERKLREVGCKVVYARPKAELTEAEGKRMLTNPEHAKGKTGRALPVSSCLYRGYVRRGECDDTGDPWWGVEEGKPLGDQRDGLRLFKGPWAQGLLDDLEGFPMTLEGNSQKIIRADKTDAVSGAWAWLEAHPLGLRKPPEGTAKPRVMGELHNVHPADRPEHDRGMDRGGRWRP